MRPSCSGHSTSSGSYLTESGRHRVVVVGGGFAGIQAVRALRRLPVEITLVDRQNFHLFQPLVYQVATGALSAGEVAAPLRRCSSETNVRVVLGEVSGFDLTERQVVLDQLPERWSAETFDYDTLVVAGGSRYSYSATTNGARRARLKSLEQCARHRRRILTAFEAAEIEPDEGRRRAG